ncbi:MAG: SUMF1/EgtB/PvdO family nonheme iron enzyme [Kofleriaceae bacterium]|nr:SUMF1/EgtB/PvdO family nonheme iron enzyme [Kofleriaceae bacterium]
MPGRRPAARRDPHPCGRASSCGCQADPGCTGGNPVRRPYVPAYHIDRTLVRVEDYRRCLDAGVCTERPLVAARPEIPISTGDIKAPSSMPKDKRDRAALVTLDAATTYCRWLGKRVPSPEEWEKAARGRDGYSPGAMTWSTRASAAAGRAIGSAARTGSSRSSTSCSGRTTAATPDYPRGMGVGHSYAVYARKGTNRLYDLPHNQVYYFEVAGVPLRARRGPTVTAGGWSVMEPSAARSRLGRRARRRPPIRA